jgi:exopolysaccharide production protein ExoZ
MDFLSQAPDSAPKPTPAQFTGVQILRFAAAMLVVAMHLTQAISIHMLDTGPDNYWATGTVGVDIFFVISGLVMSMSTGYPQGALPSRIKVGWIFFKRRLLRIVPLYWSFTLLKVALLLAMPALASRASVDITHVTYSLFFIPTLSPWGIIEPTLPVGWTLNFEMLFYVIFAFAVVLNAPRITFCLLLCLGVFIAGRLFPEVSLLAFYAQSVIFEFAFGMGVAYLLFRARICPPPVFGLLLSILALVWLFGPGWDYSTDRIISMGIPAALLVCGILWMEPWIAAIRGARGLSFLGDASYSIYLSHTFVVPATVIAFVKVGGTNQLTILLVGMVATLVTGCLCYLWFERPMTLFLKNLFFPIRNNIFPRAEKKYAK